MAILGWVFLEWVVHFKTKKIVNVFLFFSINIRLFFSFSINKENSCVIVDFDGWPNKYAFDQKIHIGRHKDCLRALGSGLASDQVELEL